MDRTITPACRGLAAFILSSEPCAQDPKLFARHVESLAAAIQQTAEDWYFEEPPAECSVNVNSSSKVNNNINTAATACCCSNSNIAIAACCYSSVAAIKQKERA